MPDGPLGPSDVVVCRRDAVVRPSGGAALLRSFWSGPLTSDSAAPVPPASSAPVPLVGHGLGLAGSLWSGLLTWDSAAHVPPASSAPVPLVGHGLELAGWPWTASWSPGPALVPLRVWSALVPAPGGPYAVVPGQCEWRCEAGWLLHPLPQPRSCRTGN